MRPHNFLAREVDHRRILALVCIMLLKISSQSLIVFVDTRRGEYITGFYVRSGLWLDGIAIMTSLGRKSQVFGNPVGGSGLVFIHPLLIVMMVYHLCCNLLGVHFIFMATIGLPSCTFTDTLQAYFDTPKRIHNCRRFRIMCSVD